MPIKAFVVSLFLTFVFWNSACAQKKIVTSFYFDTDISVLNDKQTAIFGQFMSELDSADIISISILGYCDDRGRSTYNDSLSTSRAYYVKDLLKQAQVDTTKIRLLVGNGKVDLKSTENIDEQRAHNRRVELVISYIKKTFTPENAILSDTLKVGDKIILENILFENSKSVLLEESIPVI